LLFVDDQRRGEAGRFLYGLISKWGKAITYQKPRPQTVQLPAAHALHDLGPLKFGKSAQHGQRELVLGIFNIVLAVDDDLLSVFDELANDDRLVCHFAGDAIGAEKVDCVEPIGLHVLAQLL
jgi:hypothetical protein